MLDDLVREMVSRGVHFEDAQREFEKRFLTQVISKCDGNLTKAADCEAFISESAAALGRIDILINMASMYAAKPFAELTVEDYDENVAVDMRAAFICARAAWPHLKRAGGGNIISFSDWLSVSGRPRYTGYLPYYVAKAGVIALVEDTAVGASARAVESAYLRHGFDPPTWFLAVPSAGAHRLDAPPPL